MPSRGFNYESGTRPTTSTRVIAGDCTVRSGGRRETTQRGRGVVLVKPD